MPGTRPRTRAAVALLLGVIAQDEVLWHFTAGG